MTYHTHTRHAAQRMLRLAVLLTAWISFLSVHAATVTDVLNTSDLAATNNNYEAFTGVKKTSAAVYAGKTNIQNNGIGMRINGNDCGIVTTTSGGTIKKITITWTSTTANRHLVVYGKNSAYTSASDLFGDNAGTELGKISYGTSTSLTISGNYQYIGLRSETGAISVSDLTIEWETDEGSQLQDPSVAFASTSVTRDYTSLQYQQQATTIAGYDGTLTYTCTNTGYFNINSSTGMVTWGEGAAGMSTTVTATASATSHYNSGSASYTLQLTGASTDEDVYTLVTDAAQITTEGAQYILVAAYGTPAQYYAMGGANGNYRAAISVTDNGGEINIAGKSATPVTLESVGSGIYALKADGNYLSCATSGATLITAFSTGDEKARWTIEANDGKFRVMNASITNRGIAYNYNNGNDRFGAYMPSDTYKAAYLYVKGTPIAEEITSIAALRELEDGTGVRLTLTEANCGEVEYVYNGTVVEAYVRDNTAAVLFDNFLPNDPGWHTTKAMGLIGTVTGQYRLINGMPTFVSEGTPAKADNILCLENFCDPAPKETTIATALESTLRADYVRIDNMPVVISTNGGSNTYALSDGTNTLGINNDFNISTIDLSTLSTQSTYTVTGILKTDNSGTSVLNLLSITEVTPDVTLNEMADNSTVLDTYDNRMVNVIVSRQLTQGMWNTLSLPFNVETVSDLFPETQVAAFTGYNSATNTLEFTSTNEIIAGQPYIVLPTEETESELVINGVQLHKEAATVTQGDYSFIAIFNPTTLTAGDQTTLFLGQGNTLFYPNITNTMKAFRAYFKKATDTPLASVSVDGIATGIDTIATDPLTAPTPVYNLSGQRVGNDLDSLPKGIYIKNGSKIIVK